MTLKVKLAQGSFHCRLTLANRTEFNLIVMNHIPATRIDSLSFIVMNR